MNNRRQPIVSKNISTDLFEITTKPNRNECFFEILNYLRTILVVYRKQI